MVAVFAGGEAHDDTTARILDAAHEEFSLVGIRRTSMEDVARSAGVSRVTVYRHVANKEALVEAVLRREFQRHAVRYLAEHQAASSAEARIVGGYLHTIRAMRTDPLLRTLLATDLDGLVASMADSAEQVLTLARMFVAAILQAEQAAGEIDEAIDVAVVADLMVRVAVSFVLIPSDVVDLDDDDQLHHVARTFLVPVLGWSG